MTARNGAEAVALYSRCRQDIAAVLTDMGMPIMDGAATIRAMQTMNPGVRVIAVSARAADGTITRDGDAGARAFLGKPYTAAKLLTTIREVLDAPS